MRACKTDISSNEKVIEKIILTNGMAVVMDHDILKPQRAKGNCGKNLLKVEIAFADYNQ
jgi:hypothetical protein